HERDARRRGIVAHFEEPLVVGSGRVVEHDDLVFDRRVVAVGEMFCEHRLDGSLPPMAGPRAAPLREPCRVTDGREPTTSDRTSQVGRSSGPHVPCRRCLRKRPWGLLRTAKAMNWTIFLIWVDRRHFLSASTRTA